MPRRNLAPRLFVLQLACLIAAWGIVVTPAASQARAPIVDIESADPEMRAAISRARRSLPEFWSAVEAGLPNTEAFSLKVGLAATTKDGSQTEHIWVRAIELLGPGRYAGRLANVPRGVPGLTAGDRVEFEEVQISDWMFLRNGLIVGNETVRPLMSRMPRPQADEIRRQLERP